MKIMMATATAALLLGTAAPPEGAASEGLTCDFGEVVLNKVPLGRPYVLTAKPVRVRNDGARTVDLVFEALVPGAAELVPEFAPVPEAAWVEIKPSRFKKVKPGRTAEAILTLRVPDDSAHAGRAYQAALYLHTSPETSGGAALALKPRLRFRVAEAGVEVKAAGQEEIPVLLGPPEVSGTQATLAIACAPLNAENPSRVPATVEFESDAGAGASLAPVPGFEPMPADVWLDCNPRVLTLAAQGKATVAVTARVPLAKAHAGKKYMGVVRARVTHGKTMVHLMNRVLVTVPEKIW